MLVSNWTILLISLFLCFTEGSKRLFGIVENRFEDGEVVEQVNREEKRLKFNEDFTFNFIQDEEMVISENEMQVRAEAVKAFKEFDTQMIDELMLDETFDIYDILDEIIGIKAYNSIKYILMEHLDDHRDIRKIFKKTIKEGLTSLFQFILSKFRTIVKNNQTECIILAFNNDRYKILRLLAREGFTVNIQVNRLYGQYLLHEAVLQDNIQLVKALFQSKSILVNCTDVDRNTPLHYSKSAEMTKLLISKRANVHFINKFNQTPVHFAIEESRYDLVVAIIPSLKDRYAKFIGKFPVLSSYIGEKTFKIRRRAVLEDSYRESSAYKNWYNPLANYSIKFKNETGQDYGGLTREWFSLLISRLFVPRLAEEAEINSTSNNILSFYYYGAPFECVDEENHLYKISKRFTGPSGVYRFIGSIMARALVRNIPLQVKLVPSLIKLILGHKLTFQDLKDDDLVMYRSMMHCLSGDFDFEGAQFTMPSNENVKVYSGNVLEYLNEVAVETMFGEKRVQINQFLSGFHSIIKADALRPFFSVSDLQNILAGSDKIDRKEIYSCIELTDTHWQRKREIFWQGMDQLSDQELVELVKFITGINGLPFGGFSSLKKKITIKSETFRELLRASTCFFSLYLPETIVTSEQLTEMLRIAINSSPEFSDGCN